MPILRPSSVQVFAGHVINVVGESPSVRELPACSTAITSEHSETHDY